VRIILAAMSSHVALPCEDARASSSALVGGSRVRVCGVEQIWHMVVLTTALRAQ